MKIKGKTLLRIELLATVLFVLLLILAALLLFQQKMGDVTSAISYENTKYENYYVIITDESDSTLWESIYEGAVTAGIESADAYVEFIEVSNNLEYTLQEKLRIAIDSGVDGIIISADGTEEITALIDEAVEKGIPVVTALNDDSSSLRNCFVGVNSYSLGEVYGEIVWEYLSEEKEAQEDCIITILMDGDNSDTGKNTTYLGLKEYLDSAVLENGWTGEILVETVAMNREDAFVSDETIGDIIVAGNTDVMICLNAEDTESAYQSVVDYNEVGNIEIIGYYESEIILEAIEKDIIKATISVSGEEVGAQCVMAIQEYQESGYVNGYFSVQIKILDASNVTESLLKYQEVGADEDE